MTQGGASPPGGGAVAILAPETQVPQGRETHPGRTCATPGRTSWARDGDRPRLRAINLGNPGGPLDTERAVVTWEGPGEPIVLTLYGPDGEVGFAPTGKVPPYHGSDPRQNI